MERERRKAAVSAYKERKPAAGVYAVRCATSGQIWLGGAPDLSTIQNRLWFTLRQGSNPHRSLQDAWTAHGSTAFTFEVVERLQGEETGYVRDAMLKDLLTRWAGKLQAIRI
ncbi:GIY-YIG nuclease family protein [Gluconacetobacter tumulisoli]|uniref:GIY-YIG nuclease family protein n=1 Tax=Gluconacetobacter tumulisoli TaxID=1286189 RepID=A0A7W4K5G9_9PROT|nr:GIY-YIG nuclease family protein [Gluconacetobacter tumulisoli]MBB2200742.1 GIY-YIG nuclease family protein [Gluconacetobacter tumulisoli]